MLLRFDVLSTLSGVTYLGRLAFTFWDGHALMALDSDGAVMATMSGVRFVTKLDRTFAPLLYVMSASMWIDVHISAHCMIVRPGPNKKKGMSRSQ